MALLPQSLAARLIETLLTWERRTQACLNEAIARSLAAILMAMTLSKALTAMASR